MAPFWRFPSRVRPTQGPRAPAPLRKPLGIASQRFPSGRSLNWGFLQVQIVKIKIILSHTRHFSTWVTSEKIIFLCICYPKMREELHSIQPGPAIVDEEIDTWGDNSGEEDFAEIELVDKQSATSLDDQQELEIKLPLDSPLRRMQEARLICLLLITPVSSMLRLFHVKWKGHLTDMAMYWQTKGADLTPKIFSCTWWLLVILICNS